MENQHAKLPLNFRARESQKIFSWILAGESGTIFGVSGVGKSNLFNHLIDKTVFNHYLGSESSNYVFVHVNFHYLPDLDSRSIYGQILESFELYNKKNTGLSSNEIGIIGEQYDRLLAAGNDNLRILRHFKLAMHSLFLRENRRLVLLLDQFDDVYKDAPSSIFATLRGLREAFKYAVSFLTFTRDPLRSIEHDRSREEFCELFLTNSLALNPYGKSDAHVVLDRILSRNQGSISREIREHLIDLTGGHGGLLRSACMALINDDQEIKQTPEISIPFLLSKPSVEVECRKIWSSLSVDERRTLTAYLKGIPSDTHYESSADLCEKGILVTTRDGVKEVFSMVFAEFALRQGSPWEREVYWDRTTRQVWILERAMEPLTAQESRIFEYLYTNPNKAISKEELIEAGWPDTKGGVSDEALGVAISRLRRKIEPNPEQFRYIENIREYGYRFHLE